MTKENKLDCIIYVFAHNVEPNGISGGETILIETFQRISRHVRQIRVITWKPGWKLYTSQGLRDVKYSISSVPVLKWFYLSYLIRTIYGIYLGMTLRLKFPQKTILYPSSDFWPDSLSSILLKIRYPKAKLLGNIYLRAPNPFRGFREGGNFRLPSLNGFFYYIMQQPIYYFYKYFADGVIITSQPDLALFPRQDHRFVIKGGVSTEKIAEYLKGMGHTKKIYDGVFMGRFHPQKGVLELVEVWSKVCKVNPKAKLAMIGDGPLFTKVKQLIAQYKLEKNIDLLGYVFDLKDRVKVYASAKIALHPAVYDSGGMAVAEAMACGLPAISFDLIALKTYYPTGMVKVPIGNLDKFAKQIEQLISDKKKYQKVSKDAVALIKKEWSWSQRAEEVVAFLAQMMHAHE